MNLLDKKKKYKIRTKRTENKNSEVKILEINNIVTEILS